MNKKEENRVHNVLKSTSLTFFDSDMRASDDFTRVISSIESCSNNTQKLFEIMISSGPYKRKLLLDKINRDSITLISQLCQNCSSDTKKLCNIVIRTVFGAVEHMPFRALTYLLPSIKMAEAIVGYQKDFGEKDIHLPKVEFIIMLNIGVALNELNYKRCYNETLLFIDVAKAYLNTYHPEVSPCVKFLVDEAFSSDLRKNKEYQNYESKVKELLSTHTDVGTVMTAMGNRRGHGDNSFEYAAMHPLLHDGLVDRNVANFKEYGNGINSESEDISVLISIGARPEEEFWKVRNLIKENLEELTFVTSVPVIQYISNMKVPPYSPLNTGELYLDDAINYPKLISQARFQDYNGWSVYQIPVQKSVELLLKDTGNDIDSLIDFLEKHTV